MSPWIIARDAYRLLPVRDRRILALLVGVQALLALLDLVGVLLIGFVVITATSAMGGSEASGPGARALTWFGWEDEPLTAAVLLAVVAGLLLVGKSILGYALTKRSFRFLANRQAMLSSTLARSLLSRSLLEVRGQSTQDTAVALTRGVSSLTMGVLGGSVILLSEAVLLLVLVLALLWVDAWVTVFAAIFFAAVGLTAQRVLSRRAALMGQMNYGAELASLVTIQEALRGFREIVVSGRRDAYVDRFVEQRWNVAEAEAHQRLITIVTKYVYEVALVVGGGLLALSQFLTKTPSAALTVLAVFLAASTRILPAVMRLQTAALIMRNTAPQGLVALDLSRELRVARVGAEAGGTLDAAEPEAGVDPGLGDFVATVRVEACSLWFPGADAPALDHVDLEIAEGTSVALVGPTGAGKSTLADVILGLLLPDDGSVLVGGLPPARAIGRWSGAISYVPQEVLIVDGSVRTNVALGIAEGLVDDDRVWRAIDRAHLRDLLEDERDGLDTWVGEGGVRLSGGQRQRLGLARSLYTDPTLLVLDEATSALDAVTEEAVTQTLSELEGQVTTIVIAHRLATVQRCDTVVYLDAGRVVARGSFQDVVREVPDFRRQAQLLGLA